MAIEPSLTCLEEISCCYGKVSLTGVSLNRETMRSTHCYLTLVFLFLCFIRLSSSFLSRTNPSM
jgi:hypothetical protein